MISNLKFKAFRLRQNLTQVELANKLEVSQGTITDIERGRIGVSKKLDKKLTDIFGTESGYYTSEIQLYNGNLNQGTESGYNQDFTLKSGMVNVIHDKFAPNPLKAEKVDFSNLSFAEIVELLNKKGSKIIPFNIPDSTSEKLRLLTEQQRIISEKAILDFQISNKDFAQFRASISAIKTFQYLLDDVTNSEAIEAVITKEGVTRQNLTSSLVVTKNFVAEKFKILEPFAPIFNNLANAMMLFATQAKSIPSDVWDIYKEEFEEYLELNS